MAPIVPAPAPARTFVARVDGASRGNPGPAAYAVVMENENGERIATIGRFLGIATNNFAEYQGLLAALEYALGHDYQRLRVLSDSELMVRQIQGNYRVKSPALKPLYDRAKQMIGELEFFRIDHTLRAGNREADRLANQALDAAAEKK